MANSPSSVADWYENQLRDHFTQGTLAYLADEDGPGWENEFGSSAVFVPRTQMDPMPEPIRAARLWYRQHLEETDLGSVRVFRVLAGDRPTVAIRVSTDGDDGFLEVYDDKGIFLLAGRTYLERVAWGTRDWLRPQATRPSEMPPELADAPRRTLWGKPIEGIHCRATSVHECNADPPGCCRGLVGHFDSDGSPHRCSRCAHQWGLPTTSNEPPAPPPPDPWHVEMTLTSGDVYPVRVGDSQITIATDAGEQTIPVKSILRIEFAARSPGERDIITTATSRIVGTIQAEMFRLANPWGDTWKPLAELTGMRAQLPELPDASQAGTRLEYTVVGRVDGVVTGTAIYSGDSCLATAAVHAGLLKPDQVGVVEVEILASPSAYQGSTQNGVTAHEWEGEMPGAFRFLGARVVQG